MKKNLIILKIGLLKVLILIILRKFQRSSYSTWIHHTPIVKRGDLVKAGDVLTNGASII